MISAEVSVAIVGAGPVGLALALDLGWRGIECVVVERSVDRRGTIDLHPRAAAITPRTMEFCRRWGFAGRVTNAGFPTDFPFNNLFCTSLDGYLVALHEFESMETREPLAVSPEFRERCPQTWFDPILAEEVERYPQITTLNGWELASFHDAGTHVSVRLSNVASGARREIRCRYLVGCDGGTSVVRSQLNVPTDGAGKLSDSLNVVLRIPNFLQRHRMGPAERYIFLDETGRWSVLSAIDGRELWRFGLTRASDGLQDDPIRLNGSIRRALGPGVDYEILSTVRWKRRDSIAEWFRVGNVFLAGDAAHVLPPNLGIGMNTGLGDAVDLGWKFAAALAGWGGEHLLDSYEFERRPVALRNAAASTRAFRVSQDATTGQPEIAEPGERGERARAVVAEHLGRELGAGWQTLNLQLGYRYDRSPICIPDGTPPPPGDDDFGAYYQTARPGARAPHVWIDRNTSTIDLFGRGFVLLRLSASDIDVRPLADAARTRGVPLDVIDLDNPAVTGAYACRLALVRPDGHVAWRSDNLPPDPSAVIERIRGAEVAGYVGSGGIGTR